MEDCTALFSKRGIFSNDIAFVKDDKVNDDYKILQINFPNTLKYCWINQNKQISEFLNRKIMRKTDLKLWNCFIKMKVFHQNQYKSNSKGLVTHKDILKAYRTIITK